MLGKILSVVLRAVDETRSPSTKNVGSEQVHAGVLAHHATVVSDAAFVVDNGNVEPRVVGAVSGCPDDRADLTGTEV